MKKESQTESIFPVSIFLYLLGTLLLMSGVHTGLIIGANWLGWDELTQTIVPLLYWSIVAVVLTLYIRRTIRRTYEEPTMRMAEATKKVAKGDFSVYIAPTHTPDKADYLDRMCMDFNKMVEELGSIETLKTDFFSNVSHEFKSPLAVISSNAELLRLSELTEEQKEETQNILDATRRLSNLIQNMLKLNKLEKQAIRPTPEDFDVCEQLCACAVQFEDAWDKKNIDFEAELEDRAFAYADPGLMELVWTNLLSNAVKFTPDGGHIKLMQTRQAGSILVTVADSGCGMSEEVIAHIFDKFYQGDASHSTNGNGLGLALVKRILELSDGTISVQSRPGEGSAFTVSIPAAEESAEKEGEWNE